MGGRVLSFQKKRKNQRKVGWLSLPQMYLSSDFLGSYIREVTITFLRRLSRPEPAALCCYPCLWLTQAIILVSFGIPRMISFWFRQFAPAPCSPPLGGSDEGSAVRFTPAVKYGGRENKLSRRETRCMSGHPCRAHHKLKWARKKQSVIKVLRKHLSRSESNKVINEQSRAVVKPKASPESAEQLREQGSGFSLHL